MQLILVPTRKNLKEKVACFLRYFPLWKVSNNARQDDHGAWFVSLMLYIIWIVDSYSYLLMCIVLASSGHLFISQFAFLQLSKCTPPGPWATLLRHIQLVFFLQNFWAGVKLNLELHLSVLVGYFRPEVVKVVWSDASRQEPKKVQQIHRLRVTLLDCLKRELGRESQRDKHSLFDAFLWQQFEKLIVREHLIHLF